MNDNVPAVENHRTIATAVTELQSVCQGLGSLAIQMHRCRNPKGKRYRDLQARYDRLDAQRLDLAERIHHYLIVGP